MKTILRITQGDDRWLEIPLLRDGLPQPYGFGAEVWVTAKAGAGDADAAALLQLSVTGGGVLIPDPGANLALAHFSPADTKGKAPGRYEADVQVRLASGEIQTVATFILLLDAEITRAA
jgi:hypothetical protein